MKLTGKLPHELERDDILHAAYYEGDTIANKLSQAFARYKVEQYSWAYTQSQAGKDTVQNLLSLYRRSKTPPGSFYAKTSTSCGKSRLIHNCSISSSPTRRRTS